MSIVRIVGLSCCLLAAGDAAAQQIFKCADGSGGTTYQQTPCATAASTKQVISYRREADAPRDYGQKIHDPYAELEPEEAPAPRAGRPTARATAGLIENPQAPKQSLDDRLRSIASDPAYKGSPSARRAAMNAAMQEHGLAGAGPYVPPPNPSTQGIGQPAKVIDPYTGQIIDGAIKVAPNRIWDPKTGQYREVTP